VGDVMRVGRGGGGCGEGSGEERWCLRGEVVVMGDEVVVKGRWVVVRGRRAMGGRRQ